MFRAKKLLPILLLAGLLASCQTADARSTTARDGDRDNAPIRLTEVRTPTPTLPIDQILTPQQGRPNVTPGGSQGGNQDNSPGEQGDGAPLEGYTQLLSYINRGSVSGPAGWNRHEPIDLFDGIFETTEEGSNKYGQNTGSVEITWEMTRSVTVSAYAIYTANDTDQHPDRNPKNWTLYGSADGESWIEIHSVRDAELPLTNYTPTVYELDNADSYRYYRWSLEETVGNAAFQLSEILLYTKEELEPDHEAVWLLDLPAFGAADDGREATPLVSDAAADWMGTHTILTDLVDVSTALCTTGSFVPDEGVDRLFDGIYTADAFEQAGGKLCAPMTRGHIVWKMNEAVTPAGYVLVTGNDTAQYPDRNPIAWTLYGASEDGNWEILDAVRVGNLEGLDFASHVYALELTESYQYFCLAVEAASGTMQLCELILCE